MPGYRSTFRTTKNEPFPPQYVNPLVDGKGVLRCYFRGPLGKGTIKGARLIVRPVWEGKTVVRQGVVEAPQKWWDTYFALKHGRDLPDDTPPSDGLMVSGSWEALSRLWQGPDSAVWQRMGAKTRKNHGIALKQIIATFGPLIVKHTKTDDCKRLINAKEFGNKEKGEDPAPLAARQMRQTWSMLSDFAIEKGWRSDNPVARIVRPVTSNPKGHHTWTLDEVECWRAVFPIQNPDGTPNMQRRLLEMAIAWGARANDLLRLGWKDIKDGVLKFTPEKTKESTGATVYLDATAANLNNGAHLAQVLALCSKADRFFFQKMPKGTNQWNRSKVVALKPEPWSYEHVAKELRSKWRVEASLSDECTMHGLRKHFATLMADRDVPLNQIAAALGDTEASALIYIQERDKRRASLEATRGKAA